MKVHIYEFVSNLHINCHSLALNLLHEEESPCLLFENLVGLYLLTSISSLWVNTAISTLYYNNNIWGIIGCMTVYSFPPPALVSYRSHHH